jgi:hypothetical protein
MQENKKYAQKVVKPRFDLCRLPLTVDQETYESPT